MKTLKLLQRNLIFILLTILFLWIGISTIIQAFKCPEMTQTELYLSIPKSFICAWENCD